MKELGIKLRTLESREVAKMVDKEHSDLLKDIRKYISYLNEGNFPAVDFFIESKYVDSKGEKRPCFNITKKGCELIAHKLTGQKGTIFTATYINRFHEMERKENSILAPPYDRAKMVSIGEVTNLLKVLTLPLKNLVRCLMFLSSPLNGGKLASICPQLKILQL